MLVLLALNVAAELVSFSRVIDAVPPLRWFDRLGQSPPHERLDRGSCRITPERVSVNESCSRSRSYSVMRGPNSTAV